MEETALLNFVDEVNKSESIKCKVCNYSRKNVYLFVVAGRRSCIGEGYAMAQTFLFITTIVKHFRLTKAPAAKDTPMMFLIGKLEVCAHPRTQT